MRGRRGGRGGAHGAGRKPQDAQEARRTRMGAGGKPQSGGGGIFKTAAVGVLRLERRLMTTGEITKVALERGLINCQGKTPEATMASALYTDVKRKHDKSVFTRPQEGLFGLREWINEGFFPEGWVGPTDGLGLAPFKKRNSANPKARSSGRTGRARAAHSWQDASSDLDEADEFETMDEEEEEEAEAMDVDEMEEEDSPKPRPGRGRGRGRDVSTGGAGGSRTTTTRSHDVHSGHTGGVGRAAAEAQDALESPLHILGEVAEMTRGPDDGPSATHVSDDVVLPLSIGGNKRKRRPSNVQVPDGGHDDALMPRSPLDDSLAALHEIATSPSTYAPAAAAAEARRRARTSLGGAELVPNMGRQSSLASPSALLHGMDSTIQPLMSDHGAMLLSGPETSRIANLSIPSLSGAQLLDGHSLMPMQMQDGLPATPDMLAAAMSSAGLGSLISPGWTPRPPMDAAAALAGRLQGSRRHEGMAAAMLNAHLPGGGTRGLMPLLGSTGPVLGSLATASASRPAGAQQQQQARSREYGALTPQQAQQEMAEVARMKAVVERLELRMGRGNPQVGKAWLSVARMYQHIGGSLPEAKAQAAEALARAQAVCRQFCAEHKCSASSACDEGFRYLQTQTGDKDVPPASGATGDAAEQPQRQGDAGEPHQRRQPQAQQQSAFAQHFPPQLQQQAQTQQQQREGAVNGNHTAQPSGQDMPPPPQLLAEPTLAFDLKATGSHSLSLPGPAVPAGKAGQAAATAGAAPVQTPA